MTGQASVEFKVLVGKRNEPKAIRPQCWLGHVITFHNDTTESDVPEKGNFALRI